MLEIRKILEEQGYPYADKDLEWHNAYWTAYTSEITDPSNQNKKFVGIELRGPGKPDGAIDIDHHNERSGEPAAIEQVASLIGIELNRWQKLVATNDKGYIPAMKSMGASADEIVDIRNRDRIAQGVTEEDELLAMESILYHSSKQRGVTIIKSLTEKFSPITDRMFEKTDKLLIYTDTNLNYYGKGKDRLVERFQELIKEGKAYHGGGKEGFFGIKKGKFNKLILNEIREAIRGL